MHVGLQRAWKRAGSAGSVGLRLQRRRRGVWSASFDSSPIYKTAIATLNLRCVIAERKLDINFLNKEMNVSDVFHHANHALMLVCSTVLNAIPDIISGIIPTITLLIL